ncbi:alpha-amylase family glycosyl hydrolase [Demequina sp.]|uniref:glycoside hydrolase family 13 protein n=1 Tax=Demequina sp. TaxID=2050685 RepID=UPI0025C52A5D|nr:alpha-amylase family glycosyl hydrolase [Demequina sp.]
MPTQTPAPMSPEWWRTAVIYQVYPRSFADASGDGVGDLPGVTSRLDHLAELGVDAVWLSPFYRSPQNDAGYDVSDYCDVDPLFGTLADADALIARAHELGLRVIVDVVPNHSSSEHRWFQEALAAGPGAAERDRYIFRAGRGPDGAEPPNNWLSMFGGPAWTRITEADGTPGPWYLHLFDATQPDFDWTNPWVADRFDEVLRFWFDRGADGFRIDVAHGLAKATSLPDYEVDPLRTGGEWASDDHPYWGRNEVHEIWRRWRAIADSYDGDRALVAEAWVTPLSKMARWVRHDELHQAFNFGYLMTPWDAIELRAVIDESLAAFEGVGAPSTWVLSNHDTIRHPFRLSVKEPLPHNIGIGPKSADRPDEAPALARGRAATLVMLALPGSAYVYQGEELGLPEAIDIPDDARQDPTFFRTPEGVYGRDGCRVPLPWEADAPAFGFSPTGASWLPQPASWAEYAASAQVGVEGSTLEMYKSALRLRREHALGEGRITWNESIEDVLDFTVGDVRVLVNLSDEEVPLPGSDVLLASAPVSGTLPHDTTVWLRA